MRGIGKKKMKDNQIEEEIQKTIQIKRDRKELSIEKEKQRTIKKEERQKKRYCYRKKNKQQ